MISGMFRPALISIIVVLFGVVQIYCACMSADATTQPAPTQQMQSHASHDVDQQGEHEHQQDCTHCDSDITLITTLDGDGNLTLPLPKAPTTILAKLTSRPSAQIGKPQNIIVDNRWLHPPHDTPITLKIRLLA